MKTVIDEAMVERFYEAYRRNRWPVYSSVELRIRAGLEAALTEPEEIPVTEEMLNAGHKVGVQHAVVEVRGHTVSYGGLSKPQMASLSADVYRAMESVRRKDDPR